ncbi:MAG: NAD(P)-dependent oxidoreductase [Xanthobacteraceae bacterium]|nr:NAD(P)-dependent oxidoreductase [Xanthobacteraceae bacterium]
MKVGLVGLGRMGSAMAQRLGECGHEVIAWDKNPKAVAAQGNHVRATENPRAVATAADIVLSIITEDKGVCRIFTGKDGFLPSDVAGKLFIEMSTLQPMTHRALAPQVVAKGARLIDSPVLGSIPTVREGKLFALVGGDRADVARARSVLDHLTRRIIHLGPNGAGCAMKLAINLGMAVQLQALAESLALGLSEGLTLDQMLEVMSDAVTATPWFKGKLPVLKGEPGDITLDIRTLRKDMMSAIATGACNGVAMPATSGALASLSAAVAGGWGDKDLAELPQFFRSHMLQEYE